MKKILAITLNPAIDKVYAVDDFRVGGVFRPREMTATAGGKGLNVARVAHLLGEPVIAGGFVGGGNGQFIERQARETGLAPEFVPIQGESRICITVMDSKNHTSTEILEPGPEISPGECREFLQRYQELLNDCAVVAASGSLPKGVPATFYRQLIELAGGRQIHFLLDTSGEPLEQGIRSKPYLIKPNLEEAQKLLGMDLATLQDQAEAVFRLQQQGIPRPCLTLGKDGCVAGLPDGIYHFYGSPLEVVNTVGSGDSFIAGCAMGLARQMAPLDVIKYGMASAMANTQFFQTGMISLELVSRFLGEIQHQLVQFSSPI